MDTGVARLRTSGYVLASRIDLGRSLGLRHVVRRVRANARHHASLPGRREQISAAMWRDAAAELGADVRELEPLLFEFRLGSARSRIRGQTTPYADPVSTYVALDKLLSSRLLREAGLPVPDNVAVEVRDFAAARDFLQRAPGPCVVKPVSGRGGVGVIGEVRTLAQLRRALLQVGRFDRRALVERQAEGDSYKLLVLDGVVLDVLRRPRPVLTGDGRSTIEDLFFTEYARRIRTESPDGIKPLVVDLDVLFTLERQGRGLRDVLLPGEEVAVKTATNYNSSLQNVALKPPYPEVLTEPALRASAALGVRLAGVDIVTPSLTVALAESRGVVLEVNPVPGLNHHYNVSDPLTATRVAVPILRSLLTSSAS